MIDDKYKEEAEKLSKEVSYESKTSPVLEVHRPQPAYTASNINADALNFRQTWGLLFKLNSEDFIRIAIRALKLVEEKKRKPVEETPEMSMEEKMKVL